MWGSVVKKGRDRPKTTCMEAVPNDLQSLVTDADSAKDWEQSNKRSIKAIAISGEYIIMLIHLL